MSYCNNIVTIFIIIIVIIIGMVSGYWLGKFTSNNTKYVGPNSNKIKKNIYQSKINGKCYQLIPQICISI